MSNKLREELKEIGGILEVYNCGHVSINRVVDTIAEIAKAVRPRNCDVGSVEEQNERFYEFCRYLNALQPQNRTCMGCPVHAEMVKARTPLSCSLVWSQMPYESEVGNAEK